MGRGDRELKEAKLEYEEAKRVGNRALEAELANSIADIFKNKGEYVEALRWLRIDYEISVNFLPQKQLLPTCQSMGEMYFRLEQFESALRYQKKHLELAKDSENLIEQQRAMTQLGRTYHELFLKSENDHIALRNAKKYLRSAMKLARTLKANPPRNSSRFVKELIDAHNNIGLLEFDLDNLDEAERVLVEGLKISDDEEIGEYDDARSRLHNSLGRVYTELRDWSKARHHIEKDIVICRQIGHGVGESKGYINLGEVNVRIQKYDDASRCYQKALDIAKCLEDEKALIDVVKGNNRIVKESAKVLQELIKDEQKLKKLMRTTLNAQGTATERKCLLEQSAFLDSLIEKSSTISAWPKHLEFAKRKKKVASELFDKEKVSDSFLVIGESYQKLRNFGKAQKWFMKSWNMCRSIGNLEGQAAAKINIGLVLDSSGNWAGALQAFEEGYRIAIQGNLLEQQKTALENMHYIQMIRFDNSEEARKLLLDIENLKHLLSDGDVVRNIRNDYCAETDTEGGDISDSMANSCQASSGDLNKYSNGLQSVGRKRARLVISDDEADEPKNIHQMRRQFSKNHREDAANSYRVARQNEHGTEEVEDVPDNITLNDVYHAYGAVQIEESSCSFKSKTPSQSKSAASESRLESAGVSGNGLKCHDIICNQTEADNNQHITCEIGHDLIQVDRSSCVDGDHLDTEILRIEVACRYYLKLYGDKRSKGLVPTIKHIRCCRRVLGTLEPIELLKDLVCGNIQAEAVINGWIPKRLMDAYIGCCEKLSEKPSFKLLKKLYALEVSEDEVILSDCGLQDVSISPFLNALQAHKTVAVLDISHNLLGNETMEKFRQMFSSSTQKYGGLTLDLHCNRFGPTSLFQICECPVLLARLEVLNLSENRLTDSCCSYLVTILESCKGLYSLNLSQCSITSRTIQKVADALHDDCVLSHLSIGNNNPISGTAMLNLLSKLGSLKRFSELSLSGIRLNKAMIDGVCKFASCANLSGLWLGGTSIGLDGAVRLTDALSSGPQELVKLDLSYCGLLPDGFSIICSNVSMIGGLLALNLGGNPVGQEACHPLIAILLDQQCCLKSLNLNNCHLGLAGIFHIIQCLSGNGSLEELHVSGNAQTFQDRSLDYKPASPGCSETKMEVADSEDEDATKEIPERHGSSISSSDRSQFAGSQFVQELGTAIESALHLQLLDLSMNGLSSEVIEVLYGSWSSSSKRCGSAYRHVGMEKGMVHFAIEGNKCCGVKPCCRRV